MKFTIYNLKYISSYEELTQEEKENHDYILGSCPQYMDTENITYEELLNEDVKYLEALKRYRHFL